ncbi:MULTISPECIES: glucosamine-6-phosphate deaminase [Klebsiella]|uniref:glucosamine-6-phosphate deaminase n=1 Tax=Klebsiella TaxID=570 RepID=UPI0006699DDB|nr:MULTISPECIES: glucosamine-6-phosphate deaminase [Klebsiella]EKU6610841.1 glucosamine-6-phosphate deaminase [Klebsiella aerogenes]EKW5854909.1 glucosamine-6-phosphate deaminase [Klebsiella aerogenes]MBZ4208421.1 glucosamine-6-phosphate deaminase [Klebsiella aerogenes]MBZ4216925.1 glucosamine-6-phosphate deaminase [Klebsiella aerogenes]MBZ5781365.1 glucosamine-6-phosphate deaminase [Klebsiella aerogenes]
MLNFIITDTYEKMSALAAQHIAQELNKKPDLVLALPTGGTPVGLLAEMSRMAKDGEADFSCALSFNIDEYIPLAKNDPQSYYYFLQQHFYQHANMAEENTFVPDILAPDLQAECARYERLIQSHGDFDITVLGIGHDGHIGFNEPHATHSPVCHIIDLNEETIAANARFFASQDEVPRQAITLGMGTILRSKKIVLIANGKSKAEIIKQLHQCTRIDPQFPASFLLMHADVTIICDRDAASLISA